MAHIIINPQTSSKQKESSHCTILNENVLQGKYFNEFVESQKIGQKADGTYKKSGISATGAVNLREETEHILARCNPHDAVNNVETTHLVMGYVQSGKTMSFTGLTAMAIDNKYRMVIYLAGSKTNLLNQTAKRLKKDLIGENMNNRDVFKIHKDPQFEDLQQIVGHLCLDNTILLIPILKHYKHIENLTRILNNPEFKTALGNETVLIIDDEADQASLNNFGRKNSKKAEEEEEEKSKTYDEILKLRYALPGNSYIQYTATPQANILISMKDILSPKSHTLLTPGEDYIGGLKFFGRAENHELYGGRLVQEIPSEEVFHPKRNLLPQLPLSLKDALLMHILAVAIVIKYRKKGGISYLSMMVHPAVEKKHNATFKKWIENQLRAWREAIQRENGNDDKQDLIDRVKILFPSAVEFYKEEERPELSDILPLLKDVLCSWKVYLVNTDKDAQTEIDWDEYMMHILVGAEMLNRGFTVENLATTYMPRYSTGPANADTIQQRCRFFGYKSEYIESCRVYLPSQTMNDYISYIEHEEELRSTLKSCDTLAEAERKILLSPKMKATRSNVLPISIVNSQLKGTKEMRAFESKERITANKSLVERFINKHINDFDIEYKFDTDDRTHRGFKIPVEEAIDFLNDFQFGNYMDANRKAATIRYMRYLSQKQGDDALKFVYFIQMAYKRENTGNLRRRQFDFDNRKLIAPMATGRSTNGVDTYPGDLAIVGNDSITIQLYHIHLVGAPISYAHDAYSLAINYPDNFAANYVISEQANQEEYEIEEDD